MSSSPLTSSSRRRVVPRLPRRLRFPLPLPPFAPPSLLTSSRRDPRAPARRGAAVVALRPPLAQQGAPALRQGRKLLARADLDPDELPRARRAQQCASTVPLDAPSLSSSATLTQHLPRAEVRQGARPVPGSRRRDLRRAAQKRHQQRLPGASSSLFSSLLTACRALTPPSAHPCRSGSGRARCGSSTTRRPGRDSAGTLTSSLRLAPLPSAADLASLAAPQRPVHRLDEPRHSQCAPSLASSIYLCIS